MSRRLQPLAVIAALAVVMLIVAGCAGVNDSGSHPDFLETQAAQVDGTPAEGSQGSGSTATEAPAATEPAGGATEPAASGDGPDPELVKQGQGVATSNACLGCHTIDGRQGAGPTWQGVYGHEVELEDGTTVTADADYIRESIQDPGAKIVKGFMNVMPPYSHLGDAEINALIAYIQSLQ